MDMNEKEIKALYTKLENPGKHVKCPRCGKQLVFIPYSYSKGYIHATEVKCETENCLQLICRGL